MSEQHPPAGTPEYLEYGGGSPLPPEPTPPTEAGFGGGRGRRRAWWIGGGVVLLAGLGAGAWAALGFFQQGAQPAEALPSSTVGYISIDLDPAGGQKIDAFRTLNKFPAFKDEVGVNSVDDIRRKVGESLLEDTHCIHLTYDHDIDPWLGERAAAAAVDVGGDKTDFVVVVQVKDEGKARDAFTTLNSCDTQEPPAGFVVHNGWAVLAQSQEVADEVSDATDHGTLADDATYQKWTKAVGDAGVVNAYASPAAGRVLAQQLSGLFEGTLSGAGESFTTSSTTTMTATGSGSAATGADPFTKALSSFKGGAATLRFTGDGLEFAMAANGSAGQLSEVTGNDGGALVQRLPDDTAAAAGISFPKGWLDRQLDQMSDLFGSGMSQDDGMRELSRETGLAVPADIETLLGSGVSISVGKDIDLEAAENSDSLSGLPIGVTVKGDPAAIERVLDKLRAKTGSDLAFLGSDSSGDLVAIGPTAAYRQHLLDGGNLGDDDTFRGVVPDAGDASSVLFVNMDSLEPAITKAAAGDQETLDNITPLRAMGMSTWNDGGTIKFSFKVTTN
jgi:Protein of unknown function (DUF3352)